MIKLIPKVSLKPNKEIKSKWINNKVKRCLQRKYIYYGQYLSYLSHNYTADWVTCGIHNEEYIKYKMIANSERRKARKQYYRNIAEKCKIDPKIVRKYVKTSLKVKNDISKLDLGDGDTAESSKQKSQALHLFLSSVFQNETLDNILSLNCANNSDGVCLPEVVIIPLTILFNNSIEKGSITCDWKNAKITAFKKGIKSNPANYRPISITSIVGKFLRIHNYGYYCCIYK